MNGLQEIMKMIDEQQFNQFKKIIAQYDFMDRKTFVIRYLEIFLGKYFIPNICYSDDVIFSEHCHDVIDSISLCGEEIDFFHKMVNHKLTDPKKYIEELLNIYDSISNLEKCQLGLNIKKCLEVSYTIDLH